MKYTVEKLTYGDYVWGVEVAAIRMITEEVKRPELINRGQLYVLVEKMIKEGTALIAKCDGEPAGVIAGILTPNTLNPDILTLAELIWYVLPEYRNTRVGAMLMSEYTKLANEVSDEATLSLLPDSRVNLSSLAKKGFKPEEIALRKQIKEL